MRLHLLAVPNVQTTRAYELDGFCLRTILFADLCTRLGHEVILYSSEENDAPCAHHVTILTKAEQAAMIGAIPYQNVPFDPSSPLFVTFNAKAQNHIRSVKQPNDVICTIAGNAQGQIADAHPELLFLEYSVGYSGVAAKSHRVYQSHTWQHIVHGFTGVLGGRLFDDVIPPCFPVDEFPERTPEPYVIYCGRLVHSKGLAVACEAARLAGVKLILIGHGEQQLVTYGEYLGAVATAERNRLLAGAQACLMPTQYIEPFGNVAAEAQLCGTPVISTDHGGFVDSVEHGKSGYRCKTLGEFVQAVSLTRHLDRAYVRSRAQALYGMDAGMESYRKYFDRLKTLQGEAWRQLEPTLPISQEPYGRPRQVEQPVYPGADRGAEVRVSEPGELVAEPEYSAAVP